MMTHQQLQILKIYMNIAEIQSGIDITLLLLFIFFKVLLMKGDLWPVG